jgi:hypothetical protein
MTLEKKTGAEWASLRLSLPIILSPLWLSIGIVLYVGLYMGELQTGRELVTIEGKKYAIKQKYNGHITLYTVPRDTADINMLDLFESHNWIEDMDNDSIPERGRRAGTCYTPDSAQIDLFKKAVKKSGFSVKK